MDNLTGNKMGTKKMLPLIVTMSLPAVFSMLVQSLYNVVDSIFVGQLGQDALTAVGFAFPLQQLLIAVAVGTGVGINSLVSRRLGEKRQADADKAASHSVFLGVITGLFFAVLAAIITKPFFNMFTANQTVIDMGSSYIYIVLAFSMAVCIEINFEKTLQATGNMMFPMLFQLSGAVTNIILDPIMIFGLCGFPAMGVTGAAIATVTGQVVALIFSMIIVLTRKHGVHIKLKGFKPDKGIIGDIYKVGAPAIIMQAVSSLLVTILNGILVSFGGNIGDASVAVLGVYFKLQSFVLMPVFGLTQGIMPIIGYNYGAQNKHRVKSAVRIGSVMAFAIMAAGMLLFWAVPRELMGIFNSSELMVSIGIPALRRISLCFIPASLAIVYSTLFQAVGMGVKSLIVSILRQIVLIVPMAYLLSLTGNVDNVWLAFPFAETISLVVAIIMVRGVYKNHINKFAD